MEYLIGDISKETGFGIHTLRFYEKKNLISPKRDSNSTRYSLLYSVHVEEQ